MSDVNITGTTLRRITQRRLGGRWVDDWRPEDVEFWNSYGRAVARRNLIYSVFSEHIGFSV
jgi:NNP family nitrate/nitrite transporter-like MFS transporter